METKTKHPLFEIGQIKQYKELRGHFNSNNETWMKAGTFGLILRGWEKKKIRRHIKDRST